MARGTPVSDDTKQCIRILNNFGYTNKQLAERMDLSERTIARILLEDLEPAFASSHVSEDGKVVTPITPEEFTTELTRQYEISMRMMSYAICRASMEDKAAPQYMSIAERCNNTAARVLETLGRKYRIGGNNEKTSSIIESDKMIENFCKRFMEDPTAFFGDS